MSVETAKKYFENLEKLKQWERELEVLKRNIITIENEIQLNENILRKTVDEHKKQEVFVFNNKVLLIQFRISSPVELTINDAKVIK